MEIYLALEKEQKAIKFQALLVECLKTAENWIQEFLFFVVVYLRELNRLTFLNSLRAVKQENDSV